MLHRWAGCLVLTVGKELIKYTLLCEGFNDLSCRVGVIERRALLYPNAKRKDISVYDTSVGYIEYLNRHINIVG